MGGQVMVPQARPERRRWCDSSRSPSEDVGCFPPASMRGLPRRDGSLGCAAVGACASDRRRPHQGVARIWCLLCFLWVVWSFANRCETPSFAACTARGRPQSSYAARGRSQGASGHRCSALEATLFTPWKNFGQVATMRLVNAVPPEISTCHPGRDPRLERNVFRRASGAAASNPRAQSSGRLTPACESRRWSLPTGRALGVMCGCCVLFVRVKPTTSRRRNGMPLYIFPTSVVPVVRSSR